MDKAYNIVKSVFSRHGLREGITRCNASWSDHFQGIYDKLVEYPPHESYVSKLDTKIIKLINKNDTRVDRHNPPGHPNRLFLTI